jgi:hypothetical protein
MAARSAGRTARTAACSDTTPSVASSTMARTRAPMDSCAGCACSTHGRPSSTTNSTSAAPPKWCSMRDTARESVA